jgi:hypothetical protein
MNSEACLKQNNFDIAINVCKNQTKKHQFLYASQLYGTFFAVFGKLEIKESKLCAIHLRLVNYKGNVRLGMEHATSKSWKKHAKGHKIKLYLKANDPTTVKGFDQDLKIDCNIDSDLSQLKSLVIQRELSPMYPEITIEEQLNQEVFDSEFYVKDGLFIVAKPNLDNLMDSYFEDYKAKFEGDDDFHMMLDPRVCKTSVAEFV